MPQMCGPCVCHEYVGPVVLMGVRLGLAVYEACACFPLFSQDDPMRWLEAVLALRLRPLEQVLPLLRFFFRLQQSSESTGFFLSESLAFQAADPNEALACSIWRPISSGCSFPCVDSMRPREPKRPFHQSRQGVAWSQGRMRSKLDVDPSWVCGREPTGNKLSNFRSWLLELPISARVKAPLRPGWSQAERQVRLPRALKFLFTGSLCSMPLTKFQVSAYVW